MTDKPKSRIFDSILQAALLYQCCKALITVRTGSVWFATESKNWILTEKECSKWHWEQSEGVSGA